MSTPTAPDIAAIVRQVIAQLTDGQLATGPQGARDTGIDRAQARAAGGLADHGLDVVLPVAGDERPHDRKQVGPRGQLRKCASERDTGDARRDLPRRAASVGRSVPLGIERLELRRPPVHEEEDDRAIPQERRQAASVRRGGHPPGGRITQKIGEPRNGPTESCRPDPEERPAGDASAHPHVVADRQHDRATPAPAVTRPTVIGGRVKREPCDPRRVPSLPRQGCFARLQKAAIFG